MEVDNMTATLKRYLTGERTPNFDVSAGLKSIAQDRYQRLSQRSNEFFGSKEIKGLSKKQLQNLRLMEEYGKRRNTYRNIAEQAERRHKDNPVWDLDPKEVGQMSPEQFRIAIVERMRNEWGILPLLKKLKKREEQYDKHVQRYIVLHGESERDKVTGKYFWKPGVQRHEMADAEANDRLAIATFIDESYGSIQERYGKLFDRDDDKELTRSDLNRRVFGGLQSGVNNWGGGFRYRQIRDYEHMGLAWNDSLYKDLRRAEEELLEKSNYCLTKYDSRDAAEMERLSDRSREMRVLQHRIIDRKMTLQEYNELTQRFWGKDSLSSDDQSDPHVRNPTEERPSILFGDSTEYKRKMGKLAEKLGGGSQMRYDRNRKRC